VSQITGATLPYSPEYNAVGSDLFLLSQLASEGGGEQVAAERVFTRPRTAASLPQDMWLALLMLAACLFPLDVAVRRLMWGESELRDLRQRLRGRVPRRDAATSTRKPREEGMDRLLKTKQRTTTTTAAPTPPATGPAHTTDSPTASARPSPTASVPPPPGSGAASAPPVAQSPVTPVSAPSSQQTSDVPDADEEAELDPMERLRRAKRRARGEQ
jgi:hypothetical protein